MRTQAQIQLETLFALDDSGCITATREPNPGPGPFLALVRRSESVAWAVSARLPEHSAGHIRECLREELPTESLREPPKWVAEYTRLVGGDVEFGPAFEFPELLEPSDNVVVVEDIRSLQRNFHGWTADEIPSRSPIMAVMQNGGPVSICFCARLSEYSAEAGVETLPAFRGRGYAKEVTAAWAAAIRDSGRTPFYSTSWTNEPSLAVARKLNLEPCASYWTLG